MNWSRGGRGEEVVGGGLVVMDMYEVVRWAEG